MQWKRSKMQMIQMPYIAEVKDFQPPFFRSKKYLTLTPNNDIIWDNF